MKPLKKLLSTQMEKKMPAKRNTAPALKQKVGYSDEDHAAKDKVLRMDIYNETAQNQNT